MKEYKINLKIKEKKKAFTLIELTIVLAIMAIILTVVAPNFSHIKDNAKAKVDEQNCATIERSVEMLLAEEKLSENGEITINISDGSLVVSGITGEGKDMLAELLEDLKKPQRGESYKVSIKNGKDVEVTVA